MKRVVITSSAVAINPFTPPTPEQPTKQLDESNWNDNSVQQVEKNGKAAWPLHKYAASKTLAERGSLRPSPVELQLTVKTSLAAWKFVKDHEGEIKFDLVTINPPYVRCC